jgi:hypothetical protein
MAFSFSTTSSLCGRSRGCRVTLLRETKRPPMEDLTCKGCTVPVGGCGSGLAHISRQRVHGIGELPFGLQPQYSINLGIAMSALDAFSVRTPS